MKILNTYNIQIKIKDFNFKLYKQKILQLKLNYNIFNDLKNKQYFYFKELIYFNFLNIFIINNNKFNIYIKKPNLKYFIIIKLNNLNLKINKILLKIQLFDISKFKLIDFNCKNINILYLNIINNIKKNFNKIIII